MRAIDGPSGQVWRPRRRTFVRLLGLGGTVGTTAWAAAPEVGLPGGPPTRGPGVPAPQAASRWFTTSDGVRLHYLEAIPRTRPEAPREMAAPKPLTLAFVPGWTMPAWIWQAQVEHFSSTCRVLALDPRGQGRSQVAREGYTYARRAADIGEWLAAARCAAPVLLVGWSLGVLESLQYLHDVHAARTATPVRALALVDNSVGVGDPPTADPTFFSRLRARRRETMTGFVNAMFKRPAAPGWREALVEDALRTPLAASIELLRQPRPREFWREALFAVQMPVLYAYTPRFAQQGEIVRARRSTIETRLFPEAGHALFVDEAAAFNETLERFAQRAAATPASPSTTGTTGSRP